VKKIISWKSFNIRYKHFHAQFIILCRMLFRMGKYSRILFSALLTLCLIKQSQPSPVPKYSRSIITGRDHQSNDILFRDFESSAFDSGQNGIEPLTPRRKFANRFLPKNQEVEVTTSRTYMDKILFSGMHP